MYNPKNQQAYQYHNDHTQPATILAYPAPMAPITQTNQQHPAAPIPVVEPPIMMQQPPPMNYYPPPNAPQQVPFGSFSNPNVPRGLETLLTLNQLIIEQQVEMLEAFTGYETNNKYIIKNLNGQHLLYAAEENDLCTRNCLGEFRPFTMRIYDSQRNEVLVLNRPWRCASCFFPCFLQQLDIYAGSIKLGSIQQEWSLLRPQFSILNGVGEKVLQIQGPFITFSCGNDVDFEIQSLDGDVNVGIISKQWSGLTREIFTDADRFGIKFPLDLDVNIKGVLLGATFLIDFMFFERGHR